MSSVSGVSWDLLCLILGVGQEGVWYPLANAVSAFSLPPFSYRDKDEPGVRGWGWRPVAEPVMPPLMMPQGGCRGLAFYDLFRKCVIQHLSAPVGPRNQRWGNWTRPFHVLLVIFFVGLPSWNLGNETGSLALLAPRPL